MIKDIITEEANEPQVLPTLIPLEDSSIGQEVEDLSSEDNADANKENRGFEMPKRSSKSEAVLMSDEELAEILKEEEQEAEDRELEEEEAELEEGKEQSVEMSEDLEEMLNGKLEREDAEEGAEMIDEDAEMLDKEEIDVEMVERNADKAAPRTAQTDEQGVLFEESDGSGASEVPADLDYAADSGLLQALQILTPPKHPHTQLLLETDGKEQKTSEEEVPAASDDSEEPAEGGEAKQAASKDEQDQELDGVAPDPEITDVSASKMDGKEEEKSGRHSKRKTKKQQRSHRVRKHFPQSEQPQSGQEQSQQESESSSAENAGSKAKRRRAGKRVMELCTISRLILWFFSPEPSLFTRNGGF